MLIDIRYLTTFTYDTAVSGSHNALRAKPAVTDRQRVLSYDVTVDPSASIASHTDYWGTQVDCFGVVGRHTRLTVVAESSVETSPAISPTVTPAWPYDQDDDVMREYLAPSPHVKWGNAVTTFAQELVADAGDLIMTITAIHVGVGEQLSYVGGSTEVGVTVDDVFAQRKGVCQDYAHLALACYRSVGIPARYVSGYLYAADASAADRPNEEIQVSTHAWVEVHVPGHGWWALDPTNRSPVGEQHVKIGHGRDYDDVMPLRGVYHGQGESGGLEAVVRMSDVGLAPFVVQARPSAPSAKESAHQQ